MNPSDRYLFMIVYFFGIWGHAEQNGKEGSDMAKAVKAKQLIFSLPNKVGLLSEVASAIAAANVNIEAVCAYERGYGYFMMVTDNNTKAKKVLSKMGAEVHVEDVLSVEVPNKVGQLEKVAKKIAEAGIDIHFVYGSPGKGKTATLVLKTANDRKTAKVIAA
jgi:hypothetical protein